jgi:hypothetical protein
MPRPTTVGMTPRMRWLLRLWQALPVHLTAVWIVNAAAERQRDQSDRLRTHGRASRPFLGTRRA